MSNFLTRFGGIFAATSDSATSNPTLIDDGSFVHVTEDGASRPSLNLSVAGQHAVIGTTANLRGATPTSTAFRATLTAAQMPVDRQRAPVDISVALDVSGSMSGDKLALCKETLTALINELGSGDRLGIVTFEEGVQTVMDMTNLTGVNKESALRKIKAIHTGGRTNLSGGLTSALTNLRLDDTASSADNAKRTVRSVLLLTDGHANVGVTNQGDLAKLVQGCLAGATEISLNCFGYGSDHNATLLKGLTEVSPTTGSYYFVSKSDDVSSAFGDCLGGLMSVAAQNIKLRIRSNIASMTVENERALKQTDGSFVVNLGDIFAEETRDVVIEVPIVSSLIGGENNSIRVEAQVEYIDTINSCPVASEIQSFETLRPEGAEISPPDAGVVLQVIRVAVAKAMKEANTMAERRALGEARDMIGGLLKSIDDTVGGLGVLEEGQRELVKTLKADLTECRDGLSNEQMYRMRGEKMLMSKAQSHGMQRCNASNEEEDNYYRSSAKNAMARRWKGK